ncbi:SMP-30/gluconolactonase/LRE family protein, partial [Deinococcus arboris]|uniref:SMP-30/gluconolactonase/LRE family protein n=1 Tax=Deinococcus arboris TaxID=2682977 RepID=UPI0034E2FD5B
IYAINANTGAVSLFSKGGSQGRGSALGLELDAQGRLWIAGGTTGVVSVLSRDGAPVASIATPPDPNAYLNDLAAGPDGAVYVTDSGRPVLWRVTAAGATPWLDLNTTPIRYGKGINLNGIVATPDGRALLAVQLNTGDLWRIDLKTKAVRKVMGGLNNGDGLLLDGRTLYVARNMDQVVSKVMLSADYTSGTLMVDEPLAGLRFPTTLAAMGTDAVVVQGQLDKLQGGTPETPFKLTRFKKF